MTRLILDAQKKVILIDFQILAKFFTHKTCSSFSEKFLIYMKFRLKKRNILKLKEMN